MYTVTLTAVNAKAAGPKMRRTVVRQPEAPWRVAAYGRPTPANLARFVRAWEQRAKRRGPLRVTHALIIRRQGAPQGVVAVYAPQAA